MPFPPLLVGVAGVGLAFGVGALIARNQPQGVGVLLGILYAPLVFLNLPLALAPYMGLAFLSALPVVSIAPLAATLLIFAAWGGVVAAQRGRQFDAFRGLPLLPVALGGLIAWLVVSATWARDLDPFPLMAWQWFQAIALFVIVATVIRTPRQAQLVAAGFVFGATLSVTIGFLENGLSGASSVYDTATSQQGRLEGGAADPNYLAAGVVPAVVFAAVLMGSWRDPVARLALSLSLLILMLGLAASQSRGGFVAAGVTIVTALLVVRRGRAALVGVVCLLVALAAAWFAANPAALARVTSADQGGNGRTELWTVALRMSLDNPVTGVGLTNFQARSREYVDEVGTLRFAEFLAERPHVVHNVYLQLLAELGAVGLALLLTVIGSALGAMRAAARRFRAARHTAGATLADGTFIGAIGMLTASFFLSNGQDPRLWFILGLGVALLRMAREQ